MAKPILRSNTPGQPQSVQFAHFGVLNDGAQSKASTVTSVALNVVIALVVIIITAAGKKNYDDHVKLTHLDAPIPIKQQEPPKPPPPPVKPPPPLPEVPKVVMEPPKIKLPDVVKVPEPPKVPEVKMDVKPVVLPTVAPLKVVAPAAPAVVNLAKPAPASVQNNLTRSSAVALGHPDSPVAPSNAPAANTPVNLGRGYAGMPPQNTGAGIAGVKLGNPGSGSPNSGAMKGNGAVAEVGLGKGVVGATGPANRGAAQVVLAQAAPPPAPKQMQAQALTAASKPTVVFKPKPEYTAEAIKMHLEGTVSVKIRVTPSGGVEVIGVTSPLGHGLDESAVRAVQSTRFKPALDASGNPVPWEGIVSVSFQLAG
jgi:protein TonB